MEDFAYKLRIHHSGKFENGKYVGGEVAEFPGLADFDHFSFTGVMHFISTHNIRAVSGLFVWEGPAQVFKRVRDDGELIEVLKQYNDGDDVTFYVESRQPKEWTKELELASNQPFVQVVDSVNEVGDNEVDLEIATWIDYEIKKKGNGTSTRGRAKKSNGSPNSQKRRKTQKRTKQRATTRPTGSEEADLPTFDDICSDVDINSENDDPELVNARENVRKYNGRSINVREGEPGQGEGAEAQADLDPEVEVPGEDQEEGVGPTVQEGVDCVAEEAEGVAEEAEGDNSSSYIDSASSEYFDSDDPGEYDSANSEEEAEETGFRRPTTITRFDPTAREPVFCLGLAFDDNVQFKNAVKEYTVQKGHNLKFLKNEPKRCRVGCATEKCEFVMYASYDIITKWFLLKTLKDGRKCGRANKMKMIRSDYVANKFRDFIKLYPAITKLQLKGLCRLHLNADVGLTTCYRAKMKIVEEIVGDYNKEYAILWDYVHEVCAAHPGTTFVLKPYESCPERENVFEKLYLCFDSLKKGWKASCRRIIGVDGCFLKGICGGQLLCAVGRDGNNQMYPLAWAVVRVENKEYWKWFLRMLKYDLDLGDGENLTIVSDMQKGLEGAIRDELGAAEHRRCARHVYHAWAKKWKGQERKIQFWITARSTFQADLDANLKQLANLGVEGAQDFKDYEYKKFVKVFFQTCVKCDVIDNNMCETFNGWILEPRCKSIISMLEDIRIKVTKRIVAKKEYANTWISDIAPRALTKLEKNKKWTYMWQLTFKSGNTFEVTNVYDQADRHVVILDDEKCTCRAWDLTGIPCEHAIVAIYEEHKDPEDFVAHWYKKSTYLKAYEHPLPSMRGRNQWPDSGKPRIIPPAFKVVTGRPKRNRRKDRDEPKKGHNLSRKGRIMHCKLCKVAGHNKNGCPTRAQMESQASSSTQATTRSKQKTYVRKPPCEVTAVRNLARKLQDEASNSNSKSKKKLGQLVQNAINHPATSVGVLLPVRIRDSAPSTSMAASNLQTSMISTAKHKRNA